MKNVYTCLLIVKILGPIQNIQLLRHNLNEIYFFRKFGTSFEFIFSAFDVLEILPFLPSVISVSAKMKVSQQF